MFSDRWKLQQSTFRIFAILTRCRRRRFTTLNKLYFETFWFQWEASFGLRPLSREKNLPKQFCDRGWFRSIWPRLHFLPTFEMFRLEVLSKAYKAARTAG